MALRESQDTTIQWGYTPVKGWDTLHLPVQVPLSPSQTCFNGEVTAKYNHVRLGRVQVRVNPCLGLEPSELGLDV